MDESRYWPDLSLLPVGWRIVSITWASGRATVELYRNVDDFRVESTGNHHSPSGAFRAAIERAEAEDA